MDIEEKDERDREHEKVIIALEQEIEGWKSANRILKAHLELAENEFNKIYSLANGLNANEVIIRQKAEEALKAIRGN